MIRLLLIGSMALLACGSLSPPRDAGVGDAGGATGGGGGGVTSTGGGIGFTGGGGAIGGGTTTGGGGGGGGEPTGGGSVTGGGGGATGGGAPSFSWVNMSFSVAPTTNLVQQTAGIVRRGNGETWLALADGQIYRAANGSNLLSPIAGFPAPVTNQRYSDIVATTDELFIFNNRKVYACSTPCDSFADFTELSVTDGNAFDDFEFACTQGDRMYVVSLSTSSTASLFRLDRTGTMHLVKTTSDLGLADAGRCSFAPNGDLFIPSRATDGVLRLLAEGGSSLETVDVHGSTTVFGFNEIAVSGSGASFAAVAIGAGNGPSSARRIGTTWNELTITGGGTLLQGWADIGGGEFLVGVYSNGSGNPASLLKLTPSGQRALSPAAPVFDVEHGFTVSPDEVYFTGISRSGGGYVVLHGTR